MNPDQKNTAPDSAPTNTTSTIPTENKTEKKEDSYFDIIKFAIIVLIIFLPIRLWVAKPFIVSGDSMFPTFQNGQYLIVDQISYDFEKPQRDDVIVFEYPYDQYLTTHSGPKTYYIKRIIGLPGDTVESKNGQITIVNAAHPNGEALNEPYVINHSSDDFTTVLGQDEYFVMGDNRPASSDSRIWGVLKGTDIIGKPVLRLLPPTAISVLPGSYNGNPAN